MFEGTFDDGGVAAVSVLLDASRYSVTDLVGVPLHVQNSRQTLSCFSESHGNIPGEPYVSAMSILRDASDGDGIITAHGFNVLTPGGAVDYRAELLPEITLRWVATPEEDCEYRRVAFELTVVATGEKVLGHWNRRSTFHMAGHDYIFVASSDRMMVPKGCGWPGNWVLLRDGFLRSKADAG